jgi:F-type H+-transporting ATPase subunit delta
MQSKRQTARDAKQLFRFCMVNGTLDEGRLRLVVDRVLESKRRGYFTLLKRFLELLTHEYARHTAKIETAIPLPPDLQARIESGLTAAYGAGLNWSFSNNPALIGGMRIQVGSDVYDGSVRSGLARLAKSLGATNTNGWNAGS